MAQLISPPLGETHQAAVLLPTPDPTEVQRIAGPRTRIWPCGPTPMGSPISCTRASLAASAEESGQGWFALHVPSISRAAMPERRMRGPSAHQTGPSPSQTWVGVQVKVWPAGTTTTDRRADKSMATRYCRVREKQLEVSSFSIACTSRKVPHSHHGIE